MRFFESRRLCLDALVGFVFIRLGFLTSALRMILANLSYASCRFFSWVRCTRHSTISSPRALIRFDNRANILDLILSGKEEDATWKRSRTAVDTLLTFWPPGPPEQQNSSVTSSVEIFRFSVILIIVHAYADSISFSSITRQLATSSSLRINQGEYMRILRPSRFHRATVRWKTFLQRFNFG